MMLWAHRKRRAASPSVRFERTRIPAAVIAALIAAPVAAAPVAAAPVAAAPVAAAPVAAAPVAAAPVTTNLVTDAASAQMPPLHPPPFLDVPLDHPFVTEIAWLEDEGIATGFPDGTFRPVLPVTRQSMATFLWRLEHRVPPADPTPDPIPTPKPCFSAPFTDVPVDHPFCGEIAWLVSEDIAAGYPDGTFRPGQPVTRRAMAAFLHRTAGSPPFTPPALPTFDDVPPSSFSAPIEWLAATGIAEGYADGGFHPSDVVSRQATAAFLMRLDAFDRDATTVRASVSSDGSEAEWGGHDPALSADGRFVAFASPSPDLVADDTNGTLDIFVRDRITGITERVSLSSAEAQSDGTSLQPSISGDGRYVAFRSSATNLVPGADAGFLAIYVRDREAGVTELVSHAAGSAQPADGPSVVPVIASDGSAVAYRSFATDLVPGDVNDVADVFVWERASNTNELVSVATDGTQSSGDSMGDPSISGDGRFVTFDSGTTTLVPDDTNDTADVFLRDRLDGTTRRVTETSEGIEADGPSWLPVISADGSSIAYESFATNLAGAEGGDLLKVLIWHRATADTEVVSVNVGVPGGGVAMAISAEGRFVAFADSGDHVPNDSNGEWDVFVRDVVAGTTARVSVASNGVQGDDLSYSPSMSADGRTIAFESFATTLVPGDTNSSADVFLRDLSP